MLDLHAQRLQHEADGIQESLEDLCRVRSSRLTGGQSLMYGHRVVSLRHYSDGAGSWKKVSVT